ncbi:hypothetical protein CSKR_108064 [Clonorchis sinensis]|uniref:Uncharacterized protein n=1 Tax=Clonorchis sinensis TaxID=79923 RepID=A0A419PMS0_CLOSI|nr:hypothetical protein CSKR_108064 [Clonorchis sinensis]
MTITSAAEFAGNGFHTSLPSHCMTSPDLLSPFTWLCEKSISRKSIDWYTENVTKPAQTMECDHFICRPSFSNPSFIAVSENTKMPITLEKTSYCFHTSIAKESSTLPPNHLVLWSIAALGLAASLSSS